jgi:hypothetical protein
MRGCCVLPRCVLLKHLTPWAQLSTVLLASSLGPFEPVLINACGIAAEVALCVQAGSDHQACNLTSVGGTDHWSGPSDWAWPTQHLLCIPCKACPALQPAQAGPAMFGATLLRPGMLCELFVAQLKGVLASTLPNSMQPSDTSICQKTSLPADAGP